MKPILCLWWGALALASQSVLAQVHQPGQPLPDPQAQSDLATPRNDASGTSSEEGSSALGGQSEAGMEYAPAAAAQVHPKPQVQGDVTYLCGGVGAEEATYMKSQASGYDMMLTFAAKDGSYLADVNVDIRDAKGQPILQTKCDSPIMLIDVPKSGTYRIRADAAGYSLNRTAKVTAKQKKGARVASLVLTWPQQVAEAPVAPGGTSSGSGATGNGESGDAGPGGQAGRERGGAWRGSGCCRH
ncbi:MAG TPA: hypothetical protein VF450_05245 [Noviherbaspirillum sp.]|jgi:hypothetical protein